MIFLLCVGVIFLSLYMFLKYKLRTFTMQKGRELGYHNYYRRHKYDQKRWQDLK